jgi:predicted HTH transcriptional regulator
MLKLVTKVDLDALYNGNIKESIYLEYKASLAIDKRDDNKKVEFARDVSAFANADGGQIIYGMTEKDHEPAGLDEGVDPKTYPEIWFEQVLQQHVTPTLSRIQVRHVPLANERVAVILDIPPTKGDPHQVSDGRYYRRHNYNRLIMEHYELRDSFRRSLDPDLEVEFDDLKGEAAYKNVEFRRFRDQSDPITIGVRVKNNSNQPALYTMVSVLIDRRVKLEQLGEFRNAGIVAFDDRDKRHHLQQGVVTPERFPIFREMPCELGTFSFLISDRMLGQNLAFGYQIRSPGCFKEGHGTIEIGLSGQLFIKMHER